MAQKIYVVEGRKFRTEADYQNALKDQQVIDEPGKPEETAGSDPQRQV